MSPATGVGLTPKEKSPAPPSLQEVLVAEDANEKDEAELVTVGAELTTAADVVGLDPKLKAAA